MLCGGFIYILYVDAVIMSARYVKIIKEVFFHGARPPSGPGPPHRGFMITPRHTTLGRTPLDEWSARRRDLYLTPTTLTTDKYPCPRWDSNPPAIPAKERPQTHALDRAATGIFKGHIHLKSLLVDSSWNLNPGVIDGLSEWVTLCVSCFFFNSLILLVISSWWQCTVRYTAMMNQCCVCKCDCWEWWWPGSNSDYFINMASSCLESFGNDPNLVWYK